jgi:hypothetical protein
MRLVRCFGRRGDRSEVGARVARAWDSDTWHRSGAAGILVNLAKDAGTDTQLILGVKKTMKG